MGEPSAPRPISRRRILKHIAGGAALAWSAPILTSLNAPAFAQYPCAQQCADCFACGGGNCPVHPGAEYCAGAAGTCGCDVCLCSRTAEGDCFCGDNCGPAGALIPCTTSGVCPDGWRCMTVCGFGRNCNPNEMICVPPCGFSRTAGVLAGSTFGG